MFLIKPDIKYKESFIQAMKEDEKEGSKDLELSRRILDLERDFESYLRGLQDQEKGTYLKSGKVPATTYWLIDNDEYVGKVRIRHKLSKSSLSHIGYDIRPTKRKLGYGNEILKLALPKAKELGIDKATIICDSTNIGSRKIIEKNGGVFQNEILGDSGGPVKLRFLLEIK